jgi:hypothetical protein
LKTNEIIVNNSPARSILKPVIRAFFFETLPRYTPKKNNMKRVITKEK